MKKNNWLFVASALLFSLLFYQQQAGLNFFLFSLLILLLILAHRSDTFRKPAWWYYAGLALLSASMVTVVNSDLAVFAALASLAALSAKSLDPAQPLPTGLFYTGLSIALAPVRLMMDFLRRDPERITNTGSERWRVYGSVVLATIIALLFLALYQLGNPLFRQFTQGIDLSWINMGWCLFTAFGLFVIYGLVNYRELDQVRGWERRIKNDIEPTVGKISSAAVFNPAVLVMVLFGALNLMLLVVNVLDIGNLYISQQLPAGVSLSDFVHEAVWGLTLSIMMGTGLILFFFSGELNFGERSVRLKGLAYAWIVQSVVALSSALVRNAWYIQSYQLTYLRIGVDVFLLLCLLLLILAAIKLRYNKSSWFLVSRQAEGMLLVLVTTSCVNWDRLITHYNIKKANSYDQLDLNFLNGLSSAGLPELAAEVFARNAESTNPYEFARLSERIYLCLSENKSERSWPSYNYRCVQVGHNINELAANGAIDRLDLSRQRTTQLRHLEKLSALKSLQLYNMPADAWRFGRFRQLEELHLTALDAGSAAWLPCCDQLRRLHLKSFADTNFNYTVFNRMIALDSLYLPEISNQGLLTLNKHANLRYLHLGHVPQQQLSFIHQQTFRFQLDH